MSSEKAHAWPVEKNKPPPPPHTHAHTHTHTTTNDERRRTEAPKQNKQARREKPIITKKQKHTHKQQKGSATSFINSGAEKSIVVGNSRLQPKNGSVCRITGKHGESSYNWRSNFPNLAREHFLHRTSLILQWHRRISSLSAMQVCGTVVGGLDNRCFNHKNRQKHVTVVGTIGRSSFTEQCVSCFVCLSLGLSRFPK